MDKFATYWKGFGCRSNDWTDDHIDTAKSGMQRMIDGTSSFKYMPTNRSDTSYFTMGSMSYMWGKDPHDLEIIDYYMRWFIMQLDE